LALNYFKEKTKTAKEARRNNSIALKAIQDGLSDQVKEKMRHYKSAKELWLQLENCYQNEKEERNPIKERNKTQIREDSFRIKNKTQNKEQKRRREFLSR
jgi:pyrroloquinoline quinone (PQQ) biosynthesis protein C